MKGQGIGVGGGGNPQYRCIQITDPFIHNNSPLIISFSVVSFTWMAFIVLPCSPNCLSNPTLIPNPPFPTTPSVHTFCSSNCNEGLTRLFKVRSSGMELACPTVSSIIKIIYMVKCSLSGFVVSVLRRT
jgi:hypothetical protein